MEEVIKKAIYTVVDANNLRFNNIENMDRIQRVKGTNIYHVFCSEEVLEVIDKDKGSLFAAIMSNFAEIEENISVVFIDDKTDKEISKLFFEPDSDGIFWGWL